MRSSQDDVVILQPGSSKMTMSHEMNDAGVPPAIPEAPLRGFKIAAILNRGLGPTPVLIYTWRRG
jgi:hypothetical protein